MRGWLILALVLAPSLAQAGPWTRGFGEHYVKAGVDVYIATAYDDARPDATEDGSGIDRFVGQSYALYGEVGVLPVWPLQLTLSVPLTVGDLTFADPALIGEGETGRARTVRIGDLRVALQGAIVRAPFQLGVSFEVKIPMYANDKVGFGLGPYRQWFPLPGDGQIDLTGMLVAGTSLPAPIPMWVEGGIGYRHRTEAFIGWTTEAVFVDGLPFYAAIGLAPGPVWVVLRADGIKNFVVDDTTREALTVGPSVGVTVWRGLAIEARVGGDVLAKNAPRGFSFGAGVSWRWPNPSTPDKGE